MSDRYAMIDASGVVENVIVWDGESEYTPPEGMTLQPCAQEVSIGWTCVIKGKKPVFAAPETEEPA